MTEDNWSKDMLEFVQRMWNPLGFQIPGIGAPTLSVEDIERRLIDQSRLISDLVSHRDDLRDGAALDGEADRLAKSVNGRVTLIGADGVVLGDWDLDAEAIRHLENHLNRPELQGAFA